MEVKRRIHRVLVHVPGAVRTVRLTLETIRVCLRYRVTGLASEAAFFMLLSLPPLVLGLFGGVGYVGSMLGPDTVDRVLDVISTYAAQFLSQETVDQLLLPTVDDVLRRGRADLISVGFVLSLWSGSRSLNVFVDTISIMYGQSGVRGIIGTRVLSLSLYSVGMVVAVIVMPLVLLGPELIGTWLPPQFEVLMIAYWPLVLVLSIATLTTIYHISTPRRAPWWRNLPGALLAFAIWVVASVVVRISLEASLGGTSIYGPLSTPIVLLIWLYVLAIAILIGAALNAATRVLWPVTLHQGAGRRMVAWARNGAGNLFSRGGEGEQGEGGPSHAGRPEGEAAGFVSPADAQEQRALEQQYEHRERSALAEAIERELKRGLGSDKD
ncbi:MAG: YihY/virulence factor BrkB family protein [Intrasporangium sp.]|uniref:YihY/virulence factor BrkB family protein n=1 Tax=Intrasporangium sp. TaxID=1925024 RepID=UPI0026482A91|nr:YihY/virulence factor BrkB family protein [Intrasporangium sp.]MDN5794500.1 YihY/virulence factor BrkB family protein [Intrasporangium sp.]